ncbi:MAG: thiolase domain-containing protein [Bacillota bacterium]
MRPVYLIAGGLAQATSLEPARDYRFLVREAFDYACASVPRLSPAQVDTCVASVFCDQLSRQLAAASFAADHLGLPPRPVIRVEAGGASGGAALQAGWAEVACGRADLCLVFGFDQVSLLLAEQAREVLAQEHDLNFDHPLGASGPVQASLMARRHMHRFGTTEHHLASIAAKNLSHGRHNPFARRSGEYTVEQILASPRVADPLTGLQVAPEVDAAAVCLLASAKTAARLCSCPVRMAGLGRGSEYARLADRPRGDVLLLPHEHPVDYRGVNFPGVHSSRAGRQAALQAYTMAGINDPVHQVDLAEVDDRTTFGELLACEQLGFCRIGDGGRLVAEQTSWANGSLPVNLSGGLLSLGVAAGSSGLIQAMMALWQLQGAVAHHCRGDGTLQVEGAKIAVVHSSNYSGSLATVTVLRKED